jgi:hypothetical protein
LRQAAKGKAENVAGELLAAEAAEWVRAYAEETDAKLRELELQKAELKNAERLERDHLERAGLSGDDWRLDRFIAGKAIRIAAELFANHLVPGFGGVIVNAVELSMKMAGVIGNPDSADGIEVDLPITVLGGLFNIEFGIRIDDGHSGNHGSPFTVSVVPDIGYNIPSVAIVDAAPDRASTAAARRPDEAETAEFLRPAKPRPAGSSARADQTPPAGPDGPFDFGARLARAARPADDAATGEADHLPGTVQPGRTAGVVICDSAAAIAAAARTRNVDSPLLVSFARQAVVRAVFNGTTATVGPAAQAAQDVEVVVFIDLDLGIILWIDINPISKQPKASLLITVTAVDGQLEFRCYRS